MENNVIYACMSGNMTTEEPGFVLFDEKKITFYSFIAGVKVISSTILKTHYGNAGIIDEEGFEYYYLSKDLTSHFNKVFK